MVGMGLAVAAALVLTVGLVWQGSELGVGAGVADVDPPVLPEPVANSAGTTGPVVVADPVRQPATISVEPGAQLANKVAPDKTTHAAITPDAKDPIRSATNVRPGAGSLAEVVGLSTRNWPRDGEKTRCLPHRLRRIRNGSDGSTWTSSAIFPQPTRSLLFSRIAILESGPR